MAIETSINRPVAVARTDTVSATKRIDRTYRVVIDAPHGGAHSVVVYREILLLDGDDNTLSQLRPASPVHRLAAAIAGESVTLAGGVVITAAQILEALPLFFDRWTEEDIAAGRR